MSPVPYERVLLCEVPVETWTPTDYEHGKPQRSLDGTKQVEVYAFLDKSRRPILSFGYPMVYRFQDAISALKEVTITGNRFCIHGGTRVGERRLTINEEGAEVIMDAILELVAEGLEQRIERGNQDE